MENDHVIHFDAAYSAEKLVSIIFLSTDIFSSVLLLRMSKDYHEGLKYFQLLGKN